MSEYDELFALLEGGVPEENRADLARYGALVLDVNRSFNLTGAKSATDFAPHILDSVSIAFAVDGSLVDIGSGGGLPAIPIAIVRRVPVTMVESTVKKARFLEQMLAQFGLEGEAVPMRAEVAAHEERLRERFHCATARAVATAPTVAELLLPFVEVGGRAILQRGQMDRREEQALEDAALMLGGRLDPEVRYESAPGSNREGCQVRIVEKVSATPIRFPRRIGIPEKRPLCL